MASFHWSHLLAWLGLAVGAGVVYVSSSFASRQYHGMLTRRAIAQILGVVVYRLYFHPLARYPGPLLARICSLHQLYHAWKGDRHLEFWRMHEKYGQYSPCHFPSRRPM